MNFVIIHLKLELNYLFQFLVNAIIIIILRIIKIIVYYLK